MTDPRETNAHLNERERIASWVEGLGDAPVDPQTLARRIRRGEYRLKVVRGGA